MQHAIVASARGWIGTRFHHQGRIKKTGQHKGGVDCLGLLIGVADELDLRLPGGKKLSSFDEGHYSHQPDTRRLWQKLCTALDRISAETLEPGDILLLSIDDQPQHLGIVSDMAESLGIIHAYAPARSVVEHALDGWWRSRIKAAFRIR